MKRIYGSLCAALVAVGSIQAGDAFSHTFFSVRPHFQSGSPEREMFFRDGILDEKENGWGGAIEIVPYGGKSVNDCRLAKYFMPFGKTSLNVLEFDPTVDPTGGDLNPAKNVEARHFNIQTVNETFSSTITFAPEQSFVGIGFAYKQALWKKNDHSKLWLEVAFPVERIRNKMGLCEVVNNTGGGAINEIGLDGAPRVGDMVAAFNQSNWTFGKIAANTCRSKWGVADVEVKLNWSSHWGELCRLDTYIGFVAPTGTKIDGNNAAYVFSPVVGNNHHWGLLLGSHVDFTLWQRGKHAIYQSYDIARRVLAQNTQVRSFDLQDKQWGRYMEVYSSLAQAQAASIASVPASSNMGTSGINVFTQCVKVAPRYSSDFNTAFIYRYCGLMVEAGYNLFIREAERVCPATNWADSTVALKSVLGDGSLTLARTIDKNFDGSDYVFSPADFSAASLTMSDLDFDSAAHPAIISNTVYGGLGYECDRCCIPFFLGVGGSYEFSRINTTLERWMVFGKFGVTF